ncbi:hypothetical protein KW786_02115 [Candidatus Parcubacteria bacterium]|nr:hypothetical protein [Candidatus Parcubacteria bacterium]
MADEPKPDEHGQTPDDTLMKDPAEAHAQSKADLAEKEKEADAIDRQAISGPAKKSDD